MVPQGSWLVTLILHREASSFPVYSPQALSPLDLDLESIAKEEQALGS